MKETVTISVETYDKLKHNSDVLHSFNEDSDLFVYLNGWGEQYYTRSESEIIEILNRDIDINKRRIRDLLEIVQSLQKSQWQGFWKEVKTALHRIP